MILYAWPNSCIRSVRPEYSDEDRIHDVQTTRRGYRLQYTSVTFQYVLFATNSWEANNLMSGYAGSGKKPWSEHGHLNNLG